MRFAPDGSVVSGLLPSADPMRPGWPDEENAAAARACVDEPLWATAEKTIVVTPLHYLVSHTSPGMRTFLALSAIVDAGADLEARSACGDTVLLAATRSIATCYVRAGGPEEMIKFLVERGAAVNATSTAEKKTRFGLLRHEQTALGIAIAQQLHLSPPAARVSIRDRQIGLIDYLRSKGARLTDGDFFCLWIDRAKRLERRILDKDYGAALTSQNAWTFPPSYFKAARLLSFNVRFRDGPLGRGLGHEPALLRRIVSFLGRADVKGFFPERLGTVIYSSNEDKKWRNRGRPRG